MPWEVEYTDEFETFWNSLTEDQQIALDERVKLLEQAGPALRRPVVGEVVGSKNDPRMKELIYSSIRVLFIFDPRSTAILLLAGDKGEDSEWNSWYDTAIPRADHIYDVHLAELSKEE